MEKDEITEPNVSVELEAAADVMLSLWRQLRQKEVEIRDELKRGRNTPGGPSRAAIAKALRAGADLLIDRGGKLHDSARRLEPARVSATPIPGRKPRR
jgi:hypothetical protein